MIDIHTHLLPGVDDGAEDLDSALRCLKVMAECGVTDVFLTPHHIPGEYENKKDRTLSKTEALKEALSQEGIGVNLHTGSELYLTETAGKDPGFGEFVMGDSDYILVETAMNGFPLNLREILYLMVRKGFKPILAHPERYLDIIQDISIAEELVYRNVYLQANAGSFLGEHGRSVMNTAWEMFQKGYYHFIASDHHCRSNNYSLSALESILSEQYPEHLVKLLVYDNPMKIINKEKIEYFSPGISDDSSDRVSEGFIHKILRMMNHG